MAARKKKPSKAVRRSPRLEQASPDLMSALQTYVRTQGILHLRDRNVTSVGIGHDDKGRLCVQFTVGRKVAVAELEALGTERLPESVTVAGREIPTDVLQRSYAPGYQVVALEAKSERKTRRAAVAPGVSVSHPSSTAGTLGAIVYDRQSGARCMLSNWHVLHTAAGRLGDTVVQPGPYDDNRVAQNAAGTLLRSFLGLAGDCAVARIEGRDVDPSVVDLGVVIKRLAKPQLGDRVVKSGRTTDVTHGVVRRIDVVTKLSYEGLAGQQEIGCFEIGPDPEHPPAGGEVSLGGDSGSAWLVAEDGRATDIMVGLHFAGETDSAPQAEHALACMAHAVFEKLEIDLTEPTLAVVAGGGAPDAQAAGYDPEFLGSAVPVPRLNVQQAADAFRFQNGVLLPYTHFSVCLSTSRRLPRFVAWNVDGARLRSLSRKGIPFVKDPRVPAGLQVGDELYAGNKLDRGHVARRADLLWGPTAEAKRANIDSFYFTNMTPQHQGFNQSERGGLWGRLEDAIFAEVDVANERVSVVAGPVLSEDDPVYRGVAIPRDFWKVVAYVDSEDGRLKAKAYVLTQTNLLTDLEALGLDAFRVYQVSLGRLTQLTGLGFDGLGGADQFGLEAAVEDARAAGFREIVALTTA